MKKYVHSWLVSIDISYKTFGHVNFGHAKLCINSVAS